jgi:MFS family permease
LLIFIGVVFRAGIAETEDFEQGVAKGRRTRFPLASAIRRHPVETLKAVTVSIGYSSAVYITFTYILSLVIAQGYSSSVSLGAQACYMGVMFLLVGAFGRLSDRLGRRPVIAIGAGASAIFMFVFVAMIGSHNPALLYFGFAAIGLLTASMLGPMPVTLAEQFHTSVRASAVSTTYQIGNAIGGGFAPLLAVLVFAWSGQALWSVAALSAVALLLVTVGVLLMRETARTPSEELGLEPSDLAAGSATTVPEPEGAA